MLFLFSFVIYIQSIWGFNTSPLQSETINWISFEQLPALMEKEPRKILVHIYTPWCGYCKRMEKNVFTQPEVIRLINKKFYAIKFNAESKETIVFNKKTYTYNPTYSKRRNGAHKLAIELLEDNTLYPSEIVLDAKYKIILEIKGASNAQELIDELSEI